MKYTAKQMREFSERACNELCSDCETVMITKSLIHDEDIDLFIEILGNDGLRIIDDSSGLFEVGH